jgi:hypothetical protein
VIGHVKTASIEPRYYVSAKKVSACSKSFSLKPAIGWFTAFVRSIIMTSGLARDFFMDQDRSRQAAGRGGYDMCEPFIIVI